MRNFDVIDIITYSKMAILKKTFTSEEVSTFIQECGEAGDLLNAVLAKMGNETEKPVENDLSPTSYGDVNYDPNNLSGDSIDLYVEQLETIQNPGTVIDDIHGNMLPEIRINGMDEMLPAIHINMDDIEVIVNTDMDK